MKITRIAAIGLIAATVSVAGFAGCGGSDSSSASSAADTTAAAPEMTEAEFVAMRTKRDASLAAPVLLLPSVQVNIRAGHLPPPDDNGQSYLKIPVKLVEA